jgi:hypothetical protein
MSSSFSRTGSTSNRRSANISGTRSRVSTSRAEEYADPILQNEDLSPNDYAKPMNGKQQERGSKQFSRDLNTTERRIEKRKVVTREKVIRKSPVKEAKSPGDGGHHEQQRRFAESPAFGKKEREPEEREQAGLVNGRRC